MWSWSSSVTDPHTTKLFRTLAPSMFCSESGRTGYAVSSQGILVAVVLVESIITVPEQWDLVGGVAGCVDAEVWSEQVQTRSVRSMVV